MSYKNKIFQTFKNTAFTRPLFYNYKYGLRFELSEGGNTVSQLTKALSKSLEICEDLFINSTSILICCRIYANSGLTSKLSVVKSLKYLGLYNNNAKEHWVERYEDWNDEEQGYWHNLILEIPKQDLNLALFCSCSKDLYPISANVYSEELYLIDLENELIAWPYDDRGMDIVGNNYKKLKSLYEKFNHYLLEHDKAIMDRTFIKL